MYMMYYIYNIYDSAAEPLMFTVLSVLNSKVGKLYYDIVCREYRQIKLFTAES